MFPLALEWGWRSDHPAKGIHRYHEDKRDRWLRDQELSRFWEAIECYPTHPPSLALKILIYTGARKNELLKATWDQFELEKGVWTKPPSSTKQKKQHHVPLSEQTIVTLQTLKELNKNNSPYLFPGKTGKKPLENVINKTSNRGGVTIIPAFALGRAQSLLWLIHLLKKEGKIPNLPIYLDSPMATDVTELYCRFSAEHRLSHEECALMCKTAKFVTTREELKALDHNQSPKVIISASGMATGGRVVHHLKAFISDPRNTVLFTGFQAAGTRGEALIHEVENIKSMGNTCPFALRLSFKIPFLPTLIIRKF